MDNRHTDSGRKRRRPSGKEPIPLMGEDIGGAGAFRAHSPGPAAPRVRPRRASNRDGGCPRTHENPHGAGIGASATRATEIAPYRAKMSRTPGPSRDPRKPPRDGHSGLTAPAVPGRSAHGRPHAPAPGRNWAHRPPTAVGRGRHGGRNPRPWPSWPCTPGAVGLAVHVRIPRELPYRPPPYEGRGLAKSLIVRPRSPLSASMGPT
jgi:hypothetical protein